MDERMNELNTHQHEDDTLDLNRFSDSYET